MIIFPAIDLYGGKAVRLLKGDYQNMTVYSDDPVSVARDFAAAGATHIHMVDLEGARDGSTPNLDIVRRVANETGLFVEIGGGIRSTETVKAYLDAGVRRVILGTAAVTDPAFLQSAVDTFGDSISVGADVKDGLIAIRGWLETAGVTLDQKKLSNPAFFEEMSKVLAKIIEERKKDVLSYRELLEKYRELAEKYDMKITASGGVSTMEDVEALRALNLYGAIIGKAYYTGAIDLREAMEAAK